MSEWSFWKGFFSGVALTSLVALLKGAALIKSLWPMRAKPQILEAQNCNIPPLSGADKFIFDLLVNNAGSKNCSVISVELRYQECSLTQLIYEPSLPSKISPGQTVRITTYGYTDKTNRFKLQPKQQTFEATALVKFNTNKIIQKHNGTDARIEHLCRHYHNQI